MTVRMEQWYLHLSEGDAYQAPELRTMHLVGKVYGHPRFLKGSTIRSSKVVGFDFERRSVKTYAGREYLLGEPLAEYADAVRGTGEETERLLGGW